MYGSEDFAYYTHVVPGVFLGFGNDIKNGRPH